MKRLVANVVIALWVATFGSLIFCGCEPRTVKLTHGYRLERFDENGKYYVIDSKDLPGGGVFDGTIEEIGWNQDWMLARVTRLSNRDTNGWYALDLNTKRIIGPIQEADIKTNAVWSKIAWRDPQQVFFKK
jgi:hypothetical protein